MMGYYEPLLLETMTLLSRKFCLDDKCFRKGFVWVFPPLFCFIKAGHTDMWETVLHSKGKRTTEGGTALRATNSYSPAGLRPLPPVNSFCFLGILLN